MIFLFAALAAAGFLLGAAAHTTLSQFALAGALIGGWLLLFGAREGAAWLRRR
ncbi:hypothetical protein OG455_03275 [Kitasatospora sp. NBC_01287]|uniref:hypothetical protein n=1 Tax=Kitasatospora sp. NBC_01287 TaxID=2903573 RepID=UPI0022512C5A|nr:hypothetical protein [Kitasatospora sp. NBC_01287]MCX4744550.1 hypothetical protein [Kitasatospora sp. NBC_01287]